MLIDDRIPSYYTVIPARVRYDFDLSYFEMILFSEIVALSTVHGYAFVSNSYLAELYHKDVAAISRSITKLALRGHISVVIEREKGNERKLYVTAPPIAIIANTPIANNAMRSPAHNASANAFNKESFNKVPNPPTPESSGAVSHKRRNSKPLRPDVEIAWLADYVASLK